VIGPEVRIERIAQRVGPEALVPLAAPPTSCSTAATISRHAMRESRVRRGGQAPRARAAIRFDGQIAVFDTRDGVHPAITVSWEARQSRRRCATMGVFAPLTGVGATRRPKHSSFSRGRRMLAGRLLLIDALAMHWREMRVPRDPACPVCSGRPRGSK
jgi:adenylyltransferase/sulfurtransferase